jgi:hypothetical protein
VAVSFGAGHGTLVIDPGAVFLGAVIANAADTLELSSTTGGAAGTLTGGLDTQFAGFGHVTVDSGASWTLAEANVLGSATRLADAGTLLVAGTLADAGKVDVAATGTLGVSGAGTAQINSLSLAGGTVIGDATGAITVGAAAGAAGVITIDAHASLTGFGTVGGAAIVNNGSIVAENGTLTLATGLSGATSGTVQIDSGATLVAGSSVSGNQMVFGGPASLILVDPTAITGTIGSFGSGDVIDAEGLNANTLTYAGGTLTLEFNGTKLATLSFLGTYDASDFSLTSDGHGGTDISFTGSKADSPAAGGMWHTHDTSAPALPLTLTSHFA